MKDLVSLIIPTRNSAEFLENCLRSIKNQTYKNIEVIIVDSKSTDDTIRLTKRYKCKVYNFSPTIKKGLFEASYKRNFGAKKATGNYIYWVDVDMELPKELIKEAVSVCKKGADALILPEDSFGIGIWAQAKNLERRCYWEDKTTECPRFFKRKVWEAIDGLDESLGGGGDELDIYQKVLEKGYDVGRTKSIVMHNEGALQLSKLIKKRFMYGRDTINYIYKRPKASFISYFPIKMAFIRNYKLFLSRPFDACVFIVMRTLENFARFLGILYSFIDK